MCVYMRIYIYICIYEAADSLLGRAGAEPFRRCGQDIFGARIPMRPNLYDGTINEIVVMQIVMIETIIVIVLVMMRGLGPDGAVPCGPTIARIRGVDRPPGAVTVSGHTVCRQPTCVNKRCRGGKVGHQGRALGRGEDTVGDPHRAQISQFELFEPILLSKLVKQLPVERFDTTVFESTVPPPSYPWGLAEWARRELRVGPRMRGIDIIYIYIYIYYVYIYIYILVYSYITFHYHHRMLRFLTYLSESRIGI